VEKDFKIKIRKVAFYKSKCFIFAESVKRQLAFSPNFIGNTDLINHLEL